jgi:glucose/arabinose dehydrogenase
MQSKQFYFLILIIFVSIIACNFPQNAGDSASVDIKAIYVENCSGCHGTQLQHFKRLKSYEKPLETLSNMIKIGEETLGMPAYGQTFSDKQINELSLYIKDFDYSKNHQVATSANPNYDYEVILGDLGIPWSFEFLPNGEMLIAEKRGVLSHYSEATGKTEISGLPPIRVEGQGGLLDLKLHPNYATNGWIYISYAYLDPNNSSNGNTAIIRAKLNESKTTLLNIEEIYKGNPTTSTAYHFGNRMVFDAQNRIYFSNGDRGNRDGFPQKLDNTNGKVHRLNDDGTIPPDNPFANDANAVGSIYSYGHRNPQGLAIHPETNAIWEHEHGPKGGDEINVIEAGKNYGWPVISYGKNYSGTSFTDITEKEGMEQPVHYYVPSIAPCGMTFLDSDIYPEWKNNLFIGSLKFEYLERIVLKDNQVIYQEKLLEELNSRVRDVRVGRDGYLYVAIENPGRIIKILPK